MAQINYAGQYEVEITEAGARCGNHGRGNRVYHANAASVGACYAASRDARAQYEAEAAAEMAVERYFEDRGWAEAAAERDYEDRMGVIQFSDAWDLSDPSRITELNIYAYGA